MIIVCMCVMSVLIAIGHILRPRRVLFCEVQFVLQAARTTQDVWVVGVIISLTRDIKLVEFYIIANVCLTFPLYIVSIRAHIIALNSINLVLKFVTCGPNALQLRDWTGPAAGCIFTSVESEHLHIRKKYFLVLLFRAAAPTTPRCVCLQREREIHTEKEINKTDLHLCFAIIY